MVSTLPPDELLPILVADLADDEAIDVLEAAAASAAAVYVPLEAAPVNAAPHVLEVHVPRAKEPFHFLAEPLGPPEPQGFPLRIRSMPGTQKRPPVPRPSVAKNHVRGKRAVTRPALTEAHTKDLSYMGPLPTEDEEDAALAVIGKALAGGKLLIETLIGRGGVGAVYKARHRELMMPVAVKVLHASFQSDMEFARRFYAEALAASRLDHVNITRVLDFGQEPDGRLYFAMEFLDGVELRSVLDKERKLPGPRIASIMMQVCAGLSHAHARGIVHRDIKPENLVLVPSHDDDGRAMEIVKVCDFGIALQRSVPSEEHGVLAGTPEYMSPEQCRSDPLDARSDIYACGVVLYELATGQVPFSGDLPAKVLNKHQFTRPLPPSTIDPDVDPLLETIILKALAKNPAERQQTMRELRAQLRELLDPIMIEASAMPPSVRDPSAHATPPPSQRANDPDWLERNPAVPESTPLARTMRTPTGDIESMAHNALGWCTHLAKTTDPRAFSAGLQKLEPALRALAACGDVNVLWTVSSTLAGIATEGRATVGSRAHSAELMLRLFEDPTILVQVAEQALNGANESRDKARKLLVRAGVYGAHALYAARVKLARVSSVRAPFVAMAKEFGPKAWPVVGSALEKIAASRETNPAMLDLAEDLLLVVPSAADEHAGHLVLKFLRVTHFGVCRAATGAIVRLWGARAKPVLVGMLQAKDDSVRIAAIAGLRQLSAIDEHLVPRLSAILMRVVPASEEVQAAAALALGSATDGAKQPAISLLVRALGEPRPSTAAASGELSKQEAVVVAIARALLTAGGRMYHRTVMDRAERSPDLLRAQLRGLLTA
jgi:eukaryotic-like serine/threonine-protein kinase